MDGNNHRVREKVAAEMTGFPPEATAFLKDLAANNKRDWFLANKSRYDMSIRQPAKDFSAVMAGALSDLTGHNYKSKIFRINRDLRFSKDKTPYNTHVRMSWVPDIDVPSPPVWMLSLEPAELILGLGGFGLKGEALDHWRDRVDGPSGAALVKTLKPLIAEGVRLNAPDLKRVPAPFEADHSRGDMLRRKGLNIWLDGGKTADVNVNFVLGEFKKLRPVFDWLCK